MAQKIISVTLIIVISLSLTSCGRRYPDYLSSEYIYEHYDLIDMNLVYLTSYNECIDSIADYGRMCHFIEIKGISPTQYIGMTSSYALWDKGENAYVVVNSESLVNPIKDFTIEKIELYAKSDYFKSHKLGIEKYGKIIYAQNLYTIENSEMIQEILKSIQRSTDRKNIESMNILSCENETVAVRVHFQEYENIVWDAEIAELDGKYYLKLILVDEERKIFSLDDNISYVYVSPNFDALMESLFNR